MVDKDALEGMTAEQVMQLLQEVKERRSASSFAIWAFATFSVTSAALLASLRRYSCSVTSGPVRASSISQ